MAVTVKSTGETVIVGTDGTPTGTAVIKCATPLEILAAEHQIVHQNVLAVQLVADGVQFIDSGNGIVTVPFALGDQGHGVGQSCLAVCICFRCNIAVGALGGCAGRSGRTRSRHFGSGLLRNSLLGNGLLGNSLLRNGLLRNSLLRNGLLGNGLLGNGFYRNGFLGNGLLGNSLLGNSFLRNGLLRNSFFGNGFYRNGFLRNGFRGYNVYFCCHGHHRHIGNDQSKHKKHS